MLTAERPRTEQASLVEQEEARVVATLLAVMGAFKVNSQPTRYRSGLLSPVYVDNRLLTGHPHYWNRIANILTRRVRDCVGLENVDVISGVATGGISHMALVTSSLELPGAYCDHEGNSSRPYPHIEGVIKPGQRVVVIEDHVTSGGSVLDDVRLLRGNGAVVQWALSISTYDRGRVSARLAAENIHFLPICDLNALLTASLKALRITQETARSAIEWMQDPIAWITKHS